MVKKVGRNEKCPCGSGLKYKRCCGAFSPAAQGPVRQVPMSEVPREVLEAIAQRQQKEAERVRRFGHVRPPISLELKGQRVVAVGSRIFWSPKWKTFHDFLVGYLATVLEGEWGDAELKKPFPERHPVVQWYHAVCLLQKETVKEPGKVHLATATGPVMAFMSLAYDLYTLEHHELLQSRLVERLKHKDQFQGARYETYVCAAFVRAGYDVVLEDETDAETSHCEFVATHKGTGAMYSVEAKSRHRPGYLGQPGEPKPLPEIEADVSRLLRRALRKQANHERVVFIDVNIPPVDRTRLESDFLSEIAKEVERLQKGQLHERPNPPAFVFFTNHPYHYVGADKPDPGWTVVFTGVNMPEFDVGPEDPLRRHPAIKELLGSVLNHTTIPENFDI